ncbi:MAG: DinB family protein [Candidatus Flexifilum sp.]
MSAVETIKTGLNEARDQLNRVLDGVGDRWDAQVYSDGAAWNVRQLLIHLAISDKGLNNQVMGIAEGREVIPADFDIDRYNKRSVDKQAEMTPEQARASLAESRAALLAWLDTVDSAALERSGRHASLKIMTVREILEAMIAHERDHARDIARALGITV